MTHFKEQRAYTKPREVSRNLKFVTNNTTNVCFDFRGGIWSLWPILLGEHEKIDGSIPKFSPWRLESISIYKIRRNKDFWRFFSWQNWINDTLKVKEFGTFLFEILLLVAWAERENNNTPWTPTNSSVNYWAQLRVLNDFLYVIRHSFVDKFQDFRNILTFWVICSSMKWVIKVILPHSNESPFVWIKPVFPHILMLIISIM